MLQLVDPSIEHEASYIGLVREFVERDEPLIPFPLKFSYEHFPALVERLSAYSRGEDLGAGFVPHSTYWLIEDGATVVAVSNLRHRLTDKLRRDGGHIGYGVRPTARGRGFGTEILRQTLARAKQLGLPRVLITCSEANTASARVILKNDGVLASEEFIPEREETVQRYWIELDER